MKRVNIIFCMLLGMWVNIPIFGVTRPQINVPYTTDTITVDGNNADWTTTKTHNEGISFYKGDGNSGSPEKLGTTIKKEISNEADCRVDLWLTHNGEYLFLLAEITDDDYEPFGSDNLNMAYREDTLHIYIDSTNARAEAIPYPPIDNQAGYEQFGISTDNNIYGENVDFTISSITPAPRRDRPDGTYWNSQCRVHSDPDGYTYIFEESIAMKGRPGKNMSELLPGNSYGFNAEFCDADSGVELEGYIFWSSDGSEDAWDDENLWGTMNLACPSADLNGDCFVNMADIAELALQWLTGNR